MNRKFHSKSNIEDVGTSNDEINLEYVGRFGLYILTNEYKIPSNLSSGRAKNVNKWTSNNYFVKIFVKNLGNFAHPGPK